MWPVYQMLRFFYYGILTNTPILFVLQMHLSRNCSDINAAATYLLASFPYWDISGSDSTGIDFVDACQQCSSFRRDRHTVVLCGRYVWRILCSLHNLTSQQKAIRSSPQWWSGRSTTAHIAFDLCSLTWALFGEGYTIAHNITYNHAKMCSNGIFRRRPNGWLKFERELFDPLVWEVMGMWAVGDWLILYPTSVFLLAHHWHIWSISYRFWVSQLTPTAFPPTRITRIWRLILLVAKNVVYYETRPKQSQW